MPAHPNLLPRRRGQGADALRGCSFLQLLEAAIGDAVDLQLFSSSALQRFRTSELQNFRTSELQNFRTSELQNFRSSDLQIFRSSDLQIFRYSDIQLFAVCRSPFAIPHSPFPIPHSLRACRRSPRSRCCFLRGCCRSLRSDALSSACGGEGRARGAREGEGVPGMWGGFSLRAVRACAGRAFSAPAFWAGNPDARWPAGSPVCCRRALRPACRRWACRWPI